MAQIHQVIASEQLRHEIDPLKGSIVRRDKVLKKGDVHGISAGDGQEFEIQADGTFDVPEEVAGFFLKQPDWYPGPNPFVLVGAATDTSELAAREAALADLAEKESALVEREKALVDAETRAAAAAAAAQK